MSDPRFCDRCDRSIPAAEPAYRTGDGLLQCAECETGAIRVRNRNFDRRRQRARLYGRLVGIAVLLLLGILLHGAVHNYLVTHFGDSEQPQSGSSSASLPEPSFSAPAADPAALSGEANPGSAQQTGAPPPASGETPATEPPVETVESVSTDPPARPEPEVERPGAESGSPTAEVADSGTGEPGGSEAAGEPADLEGMERESADPAEAAADLTEPGPADSDATEPTSAETVADDPPAGPDRFVGRFSGRLSHRGAPADTRRAVDAGLDWLARHQETDGSWSSAGFSRRCGETVCTGPGDPTHDVGVTGLALLALLGAGHSADLGRYRAVVRSGLDWLVSMQDRGSGCIGKVNGHSSFLYDHAVAAQALVEGYGLSHREDLREPAQAAVDFVHFTRNSNSAWRYSYPPSGSSDTSVTGWMVAVLATARDLGLDVDPAALAGAHRFALEMTAGDTGRTGYNLQGGFSSREPGMNKIWSETRTEAMTATALRIRLACGDSPASDLLKKSALLVTALPPRWEPGTGRIDFYFWFQGSYAMRGMGGAFWKGWEPAMREVIVGSQRRAGGSRGSWDPEHGPWGHRGGRIYSTSLMLLCLESYYRFMPQASKSGPAATSVGSGMPDAAVVEGVLSAGLQAILASYEESRGDRARLMKVHTRLVSHARRFDGTEQLVARLYAGHALAEAGELEHVRRIRDRMDKFRRATLLLREVMEGEVDLEINGESCQRRAAQLRQELHQSCIRYFESRRSTEAGYSDFDFKNDTGYHRRGLADCAAALD